MIVDEPSDELCQAASQEGILLAAKIGEKADVASELRRLSQWPSVGVAIIGSGSVSENISEISPNIVLAQIFPSPRGSMRESDAGIAEWADAIVVGVDDRGQLSEDVAQLDIPVLAIRLVSANEDFATARAACDRLQRDLAAQGDFAGYLV